jgi:cytochrome c peroxidase
VKIRLLMCAFALVFLSTLAIRASAPAAADCGGEPCDAVVRGLVHFVDRHIDGLDGNGRACGDCHMPSDNFQLSPANAEARFRLLQLRRRFDPSADDPLFRAIDADDFRVNGENAHDFSNLRQNGLVRVTLPLPANVKLIDPATNLPSAETFVDVWRMVPSVNNVALTGPDGQNPWFRGPNSTGGYQLDARLGTLQEQAHGAFVNHAQVTTPIAQGVLDDLSSFQRVLFSSPRVRALSDAVRAGASPPPDADPPLTPLEQQGKVVFARACSVCHGGPGQSTSPAGVVRMHDIATGCPRPVDPQPMARFLFSACSPQLLRNVRTYEITIAPTVTIRRSSSDPGRALLTGFVGGPPPFDDWNKMDVPGLRGIKDTAPYFQNNSAPTLEAVFDHYVQVFRFIKATAPPGPPPPVASTDGINYDRQPLPSERDALVAYLKRQ